MALDQCLPGCSRVYYVKQLSPSDAACSKQIKLPKSEAKQFVGELRHKQSIVVGVMDQTGGAWEFLCTCYGCQYALSRVGNFCNAFRLKASQFLIFYRDHFHQLRVAVMPHLTPELHMHLWHKFTGTAVPAAGRLRMLGCGGVEAPLNACPVQPSLDTCGLTGRDQSALTPPLGSFDPCGSSQASGLGRVESRHPPHGRVRYAPQATLTRGGGMMSEPHPSQGAPRRPRSSCSRRRRRVPSPQLPREPDGSEWARLGGVADAAGPDDGGDHDQDAPTGCPPLERPTAPTAHHGVAAPPIDLFMPAPALTTPLQTQHSRSEHAPPSACWGSGAAPTTTVAAQPYKRPRIAPSIGGFGCGIAFAQASCVGAAVQETPSLPATRCHSNDSGESCGVTMPAATLADLAAAAHAGAPATARPTSACAPLRAQPPSPLHTHPDALPAELSETDASGWGAPAAAPPHRAPPPLAKQLTKMDVACAHDTVGIVVPVEQALASCLLQPGDSSASFWVQPTSLAAPAFGLQLSISSSGRFCYMTGLGGFLREQRACAGDEVRLQFSDFGGGASLRVQLVHCHDVRAPAAARAAAA